MSAQFYEDRFNYGRLCAVSSAASCRVTTAAAEEQLLREEDPDASRPPGIGIVIGIGIGLYRVAVYRIASPKPETHASRAVLAARLILY